MILIGALTALSILVLNIWYYRHIRNGQWHPADESHLMRRWIPGKWEYRGHNEDEFAERSQSW